MILRRSIARGATIFAISVALSACASSEAYAPVKSRICTTCTRTNIGASTIAFPARGFVIRQGSAGRVFDVDGRTFTYTADAVRRQIALSDADYSALLKATNAAWAPASSMPAGFCLKTDNWSPTEVMLLDGDAIYANYECRPDISAEMLLLISKTDLLIGEDIKRRQEAQRSTN